MLHSKFKLRRVEHNMPKTCSCGDFSRFHRRKASAFLPPQTQKFIRNSCVFGASQFKIVIFLLKQGTKSMAYCRMPRFLTQFQRKYTVLNHIGFGSPQLNYILTKYASKINDYSLEIPFLFKKSTRLLRMLFYVFAFYSPQSSLKTPSNSGSLDIFITALNSLPPCTGRSLPK